MTMTPRKRLLFGARGPVSVALPTMPVPELGAELLTNGDFSAWTGGNPDSWVVTGEVGTDPEVSQVGSGELHGGAGTGAANFYRTAGGFSALYLSQAGVMTKDVWVRAEQICSASANGEYLISAGNVLKNIYSGVRTLALTELVTATGALRVTNYRAPADYTIDSVSVRPLVLASLIGNPIAFGPIASISARLTQAASVVADVGIIFNLDSITNPKNFLLAAFNGVYTVSLRKCVNGVYTTLTSGTVSYAANAEIKVTNVLNTFTLWYKGAVVGTPQTVTDVGIINNGVCGVFATDAGTLVKNLVIS